LRARIVESKDRVYFSDTSLNLKEFAEAFQQTGINKVPLRVLLPDPKSPMARERWMNLYGSQNKEDLQYVSRLNIAALTALCKKHSLENMELRLHSTMPALQIFICDNVATIGFYFYGKDSQVAPQLEVLIKDKKGEYTLLGKYIEGEFETRWNLATPILL
jgi:hypothetical protein